MKFEELPKPIKVGTVENIIGNKYDDLTVLYRVPNKNNHPQWACICTCGEYCIRRSDTLKSNTYSFCKLPQHSSYDLIGQKRGHLTIAKRTDEYKRNTGWRYICYCDCGNSTPIIEWGKSLAYDRNQSCGCAKNTNKNEITGQKFGYLLAIKPIGKNNDGAIIWECQCDCGNIHYAASSRLISNEITSCGCRNRSIGEENIQEILLQNNIIHTHNKTFLSCKFPDSNKFGFFDFYINEDFLLEFDGEQHIRKRCSFFGEYRNYEYIHNHDLFKNQWAWDNKISMKRIPYSERDALTLERIMSDEFLITPQTHPEWYPPKDSTYPYFTLGDIDKLKEVL